MPVVAAAIDARGDALLVSERVGLALSDPARQIDDLAIGVDEAAALAAALCYRLITFYIPPLLGARAFRSLQRQKLL